MKQIFRNIFTPPIPKHEVGEVVYFREPFVGISEGIILSVKTSIFHRVTYIIDKDTQDNNTLKEVLEDDIFKQY